ncbi:Gypsy retrotransposon integrase-like protein 1 [Marasmius tenuissimus]|nr:Gypsy retrotransposon integrase-like protein 1 [Marasmius tenuissimus]
MWVGRCLGGLGGVTRPYSQATGVTNNSEGTPPLNATSINPSVQSQLWNRAFWGLASIDVAMSLIRGVPRAMHTDDFDLPLPLDCDDEYWVLERQGERDDAAPDQEFKQPEDKPSRLSYWVTLLKLLDIVSFVQKTLYSVRKTDVWTRMEMTEMEWNEKIGVELNKTAVIEWFRGTPPFTFIINTSVDGGSLTSLVILDNQTSPVAWVVDVALGLPNCKDSGGSSRSVGLWHRLNLFITAPWKSRDGSDIFVRERVTRV